MDSKTFRTLFVVLGFFSISLFHASAYADHHSDGDGIRELTFGVYAHIRPTEMLRKMEPLRDYLEKSLNRAGRPIKVSLRIYPTYSEGIDALVKGDVDFVRFGPVSYVLAKQLQPKIRLLAMESNGGSKRFNGVISVPLDSPINSMKDLKGKRIAFGNPRSTAGRFMAQAALVKEGITGKELAGHAYLGRHDKVAFAVAANNYDAGAINENTFHKNAHAKGLRKLLAFPCVTKPWVASSHLGDELFADVQQTLLHLKDKRALKPIKRDGFLSAVDGDYDLIREGMLLAKRFASTNLKFALYASEKPSELYLLIQPILTWLEQQLILNGTAVDFDIKIYNNYQQAIDVLALGQADIGRLGPASFLLAKRRNSGLELLVGENGKGCDVAHVITLSNSGIENLQQLKGKRFAFGDPHSTEGRYMAQALMVDAGLSASMFSKIGYLGRHDRVAFAVANDNYDAGAIRCSTFKKYGEQKSLKSIAVQTVPGKVWVVQSQLDGAIKQLLRKHLLAIKEGDAAGSLAKKGFIFVEERDFREVEDGMARSKEFSKEP